jgi:hypothetical protein
VRPEPASLSFWIAEDEVAMLDSRDGTVRMDTYNRIDRRRGMQNDWRAQNFRNVNLRWPVMASVNPEASSGILGARASRAPSAPVTIDTGSAGQGFTLPVLWDPSFDGGTIVADVVGMDVSEAVRADWEREQPGRIARALARAAVREVTAKGAEGLFGAAGDVITSDDDDDEGAGKGWLAAGLILAGIGMLALHVGSQVLDQPDLRAWQLLPDRVTVARMRLPVGEHVVEVTRNGEAYSLGTVTVKPGSVSVLVHRWWPGQQPVVAAVQPDPSPLTVEIARPK